MSTKHSSGLLAARKESRHHGVESSHCLSRRHFRPRGMNVCLLLSTERNRIRECLCQVIKKGKENNYPRVAFTMDAEALPTGLLFKLATSQFERISSPSLVTELHYGKSLGGDGCAFGPGSAIDVLCDFGPHIHSFCALGFSSATGEALAVLRASDPVILHHIVWVSPPRAQ